MNFSFKPAALALVLALSAVGTAHAATPAGKPVNATIKLQGGSDSSAEWKAPLTSAAARQESSSPQKR